MDTGTKTAIAADTIGLGVLAAETELLVLLTSTLGVPFWGWTLAYVFLAACALFAWHGEKWPKEPRAVLKVVLLTLLLGGLFFGADLILGHFDYPELPLFRAAVTYRGFILTALVFPLTTMVVLAGYLRAIFLD